MTELILLVAYQWQDLLKIIGKKYLPHDANDYKQTSSNPPTH